MKKKMSRKNLIIATSILVGSVSIGGGVTYGVVQGNHHKQRVANASTEIKQEMATLDELFTKLKSFETSDGYLAKELNIDELSSIKKSVNSIKDSHSDFHIEKDDLKSEIKVIKVDVKSIKQKVKLLELKLSVQNDINSLFERPVIVGSQVVSQPIKAETTSSTVDTLKTTHESVLKNKSNWVVSLNKTLDDAVSQLKQIDTAKAEVSKLVKDDVVVTGVSRDGYNKAKSQVDKIKNETIKSELMKQLDLVMTTVKKNEADAKAEAEAEAKAKAEAEEKARQESVEVSVSNETNSGTSSNSRSNNVSSNESSKQSSYSNKSKSSSNGNSSSSTSSSKKSNSGTSSSNSTKSSNNTSKSSSNTSKSSNNTNKSSNNTSNSNKSSSGDYGTNVKKDGGGTIKNNASNDQSGAPTYETGTFELPANYGK